MRPRDHRRLAVATILLASALGGAACARLSKGAPSPRVTYPLVVNNRSDFEVVVYAVPSPGSNGIRIGNARSFSTTKLTVPRNGLQGAGVLVVRLHGIGSSSGSRSWTSPATPIDESLVAQLDIRADPSGNMRGSTLYTSTTQSAGRHP
jgi:hypothetical protein